MNCQFDSYPPPILQWTKISEDGEEILIDDNNHQVIEIVNKQISPTIYHTQLTVILLLIFIEKYSLKYLI